MNMAKDSHSKKHASRFSDFHQDDFIWDRSTSEPDLTETHHIIERWPIRFPHECISVDDLKFFRRRKPKDFHTRSNICLYDKTEHVLPFASIKSEYTRRFTNPDTTFFKPGLRRKSTSLKLEGKMDTETEHKSKYLPYPEDEMTRCRRSPSRNRENFILGNELEMKPEYKSAFVSHLLPKKLHKKESLKINGNSDLNKSTYFNEASNHENESKKCHLKLEGEMSYLPEYRSQYIQFPIEKSHSIPQLSNIKFHGDFIGIPEYTENFKCYDIYSKSEPIKKADHLQLNGTVNASPEYKEKYQVPNFEKTNPLQTADHLMIKGDFTKDLPEYNESFQDPKITEMPERGKCREPYLRLKGKIEFNPEYRSTYLDYPRSRPITKKSTSTFKLSNNSNNKTSFEQPPQQKVHQHLHEHYHQHHHPDEPTVELTCRPEYRKAKREFMIKERPLTRKITENDGTTKVITKNYSEPANDGEVLAKFSAKGKKKRSPRKHGTSSPQFKVKVENIDDFDGNLQQKTLPKFGRRASVSRNSHYSRSKTNIIEGNPKYIKNPENNSHGDGVVLSTPRKGTESFVVLDEPCKQSAWMKKSWYET